MSDRTSPFELNRWENEDARHFYFLNTAEYRKIRDSRKHCFIIGHRGTGKTSLLKALDWHERTTNDKLAHSLPSDPFHDGVIGCYFGLQYLHVDTLDSWVAREIDSVKHDVLSSYLRGLWLEKASAAVSALRGRANISSLDDEIKMLSEVADEWNAWLNSTTLSSARVAEDEYLSLRRIRDTAALLSSEIYARASDLQSRPSQAIRDLALNRLPALVNQVFSALAKLLPSRPEGSEPWLFQMCLDEGEHLSDSGRRTIRTLVRECRSPLLMTVASLDDFGVETLNPRVRLTVNDRLLLDLRKRTPKQFGDLVDGVINERLKTFDAVPTFKISELLSDFDLNDFVLQAGTERPSSRRQLSEWSARWANQDKGDWSPIRDYLLGANAGSVPVGDNFDRRAADSAGYRKKELAAYLQLMAVLGEKQPIYAGATIVLRTMENSLRDLFMFLEQCFQQNVPPGNSRSMEDRLRLFLNRKPVPIKTQNIALAYVSKQKMDNLDERVVTLTSLSRQLVEFFSRLSHRLDMEATNAPIASPERTMFVIRLPVSITSLDERREDNARMRAVVEAIHNCAREGYLVGGADSSESRILHVRVNRTLAKLHGFSYRAPQYESVVDWSFIDAIALGRETNIDRLAQRASQDIRSSGTRPSRRPDESQLSTFVTLPLFDDLLSPE